MRFRSGTAQHLPLTRQLRPHARWWQTAALTCLASCPFAPLGLFATPGSFAAPGLMATGLILPTCGGLMAALLANTSVAQDRPPQRYSDEVLEKAERILGEHGLRRVGTQIQPTEQTEFSRLISEETRLRRSLRQQAEQYEATDTRVQQIEQQFIQLEQQLGVLNARYAAVGNPGGRNNDLVARLNAGSAQLKQLKRTFDQAKETAKQQRGLLQDEEAAYAEHILKMRKAIDAMRETLVAATKVREVKIAYEVLATKYSTPAIPDIEAALGPLDRRVRKLEASVFSESIPLDTAGGGLTVNAVVGLERVTMLVDSGAAIVLLPKELAEKANVKPVPNAKPLTLVTADGRRIQAPAVLIPRMRVGQFEAEDVKAAVLDDAFKIDRPLLGLSFLERFRFEIDPAKQQLKLLRVEASED